MSLNEIRDLRKTNFSMGGEGGTYKDTPSIYTYDYRRWPNSVPENMANKYKFKKTGIVGEEGAGNPGRWATTNLKDFTKHEGVVPSQLNEDTKRDLRSHHFEFGRFQLPFRRLGKGPRCLSLLMSTLPNTLI